MTEPTVRARRPRRARACGLVAATLLAALCTLPTGCAHKGGTKTAQTSAAPEKSEKSRKSSKSSESKSSEAQQSGETNVAQATTQEPDHIKVQHILIGFTGSVPGKSVNRTLEEAKALAYSLLDSARTGVSFDDLVARHTDDRPPGIYGMSNRGVAPAPGEFARGSMVPAFGDVGFKLAVGEIGVADYDPRTSPYGYHVIKRVE